MKELDELRGSLVALTALIHAMMEAHPKPTLVSEIASSNCQNRATAMLLATISDDQTR